MIVKRRDRDPLGQKARHDVLDLLVEQYEIAHDHGVVAHFLERRIGAQREAGLDVDALNFDLQIRAGHRDAKDVTRLQLA